MKAEIFERTPDELRWDFNNQYPAYVVSKSKYPSTQSVDPFVCYAHDAERVKQELEKTIKAFPCGVPLELYILHNEPIGRTNGWFSYETDWDAECEDKDRRPWIGRIVLGGKRIPIHPAMTRYLVAHEYGHFVEEWISRQRGFKEGDNTVLTEYMEMRGMTQPPHYGGGTWHLRSEEVFANDFRILVCDAETEFWPHEVPHPKRDVKAIEWWQDAAKYKFKGE